MKDNLQVNFWRGQNPPPTIYHIWIKDNNKLLVFDGTEWLVFMDNQAVIDLMQDILEKYESFLSVTINGKPIKDNPVLNANDIQTDLNGNFVSGTIKNSISTLDTLLTTQFIE